MLLAVTLNPVVDWLERRGWPRWAAATAGRDSSLVAVVGGFGWLTWTSVPEQAVVAAEHISRSSSGT